MGKKIINPLLEVVNKKSMLINSYRFGGIPRDGLIGEWLFSGNANDTSGAGHNGTVNGATLAVDRKGIANKAYSFDGLDDYIEIGDYCDMGLLDMTISFWAKLQTTVTYQGLVQKSYGGTTTNKWYVITETVTKKYQGITVYNSSTEYNLINSNSAFSGNWQHILVSYNRTGLIQMYVDNVLQSESQDMSPYSAVDVSNTFNLRFGCFTSNTGLPVFFTKGSIDDVRIYNRVLTASEKLALYNE